MSNTITVVGTVATDPRIIQTQSGIDLCSFRIASGDRRYDREQQKWVDGETNWYGVTAFRTMALHAHESFHKGERVIISGRLRLRRWENGEKSGLAADIEVDAIGHDVRWGVSRFEKRSSTGDDQSEDLNSEARASDGTSSQDRWAHPEKSREAGPVPDGFIPA